MNRPDVTQDVNKIVGDFTDVNVTAIALDFSKNFIERARTIQNDLWVDLEHNAFLYSCRFYIRRWIPVSKGSSHNAFWISASASCSK